MKSILVTGGAGKIGYNFVQKLIDTNYNVTVLDLESKVSIKKLSNFKNSVKVVYGDVEDTDLIKDLVKRNDVVIDFAGIMPPLANLNESIANSINFGGTKNIVDAILELNPGCVYIYMSFISVYGLTDLSRRQINLNTESNHPDDYYSVSIERSEKYIKEKLKKYSIVRMPIVLTPKNYFLDHMKLDVKMDFITKEDLNDVIFKMIESNKVLGKTYNISGFVANTSEVVRRLYETTGVLHIMNRNLYYGSYEDGDKLLKLTGVKPTGMNEAFTYLGSTVNPLKKTTRKILNSIKWFLFNILVKKKK